MKNQIKQAKRNRLTIAVLATLGIILATDHGERLLISNASAENALTRNVKSPLDRSGRFFGVGYGDGYQACEGSGFRPGADLPPHSFHRTQRRSQWFGNTYYDHFDNYNVIHPRDYKIRSRSAFHSCDDVQSCDDAGTCDRFGTFQEIADQDLSANENSAAKDFAAEESWSSETEWEDVASIDAPIVSDPPESNADDWLPLANHSPKDKPTRMPTVSEKSGNVAVKTAGARVDEQLPLADRLPPGRPNRLPSVAEQPGRVARNSEGAAFNQVPRIAAVTVDDETPTIGAETADSASDSQGPPEIQLNPFMR